MLTHASRAQKIGYGAVGALVMFGVGTALVRGSRPTPPIVFESPKEAAKTDALKGSAQQSGEVVVHVAGAVKSPGVYRLPAGARLNQAIAAAGNSLGDADLDALNLAALAIDGSQIYVPHKRNPLHIPPEEKRSGIVKHSPWVEVPPVHLEIRPEYRAKPMGLASNKKADAANTGSSNGGAGLATSLDANSSDGQHATVGSDEKKETSSDRKPLPSASVNLNTATADQFQTLPGVGPATVQRILDYRAAHGGFTRVEDLIDVKGIGPKKFEAMRPYVRL
jgi:competence protein ComEA